MLKPAVFVLCSLLVAGLPVRAADLSPQLQAVRALVENKKYVEAIAQYERLLQEAPRPLQGPVQFEIAALHAAVRHLTAREVLTWSLFRYATFAWTLIHRLDFLT